MCSLFLQRIISRYITPHETFDQLLTDFFLLDLDQAYAVLCPSNSSGVFAELTQMQEFFIPNVEVVCDQNVSANLSSWIHSAAYNYLRITTHEEFCRLVVKYMLKRMKHLAREYDQKKKKLLKDVFTNFQHFTPFRHVSFQS